ncbi:MAG: hypothetical protein KGY80_08025 [Candidatus Thorarchaeota archaeon]|nr:hypothetical protein [Candidatus Thorarchaeota archaeon]
MSQLHNMINMIQQRTDKRADEIIQSAKSYRNERLQIAREKAEKQAQEILNQAKTEYKEGIQKAKSRQSLQCRMGILDAKHELLQQVISEGKEQVYKVIGSKEYKKILTRLAAEAGEVLDENEVVIQVPEGHEKYLDVARIEKEASGRRGKKISITISDEPVEAKGGVVVRNLDNTKWVDNTFGGRIDRLLDDIRQRVSSILFGDDIQN